MSTINTTKRSVLQDWVLELPFMQQAVLMASIRGPDGIRKDHPTKVLCRFIRRSMLLCAFHGKAHLDPYHDAGCGSFTGACYSDEVKNVDHALELYLRSVDELPHHFQLHFMHAAEIIGYKHPNDASRKWWNTAYLKIVNDAHLFPESEALMDERLADLEANWRAREEVTAR